MISQTKTYIDGLREASRICDSLALRAALEEGIASIFRKPEPAAAAPTVVPATDRPRFELVDSVQVIDRQTGLVWMRDTLPGGRRSWDDARRACESVEFEGHKNWRLPTVEELLTLVDRTRHSPAIATDLLRCESSWYWTSTQLASAPGGYAWGVYFGSGNAGWNHHGLDGFVRACRASQ